MLLVRSNLVQGLAGHIFPKLVLKIPPKMPPGRGESNSIVIVHENTLEMLPVCVCMGGGGGGGGGVYINLSFLGLELSPTHAQCP